MAWIWIGICSFFLVVGIYAIRRKKDVAFQIIGWIFTILSAVVIVFNIPYLNIDNDNLPDNSNSFYKEPVSPSFSSDPVYVDDMKTPVGTAQVIIAENIIVEESNSYYDEESRFTFSPNTIFNSFISATITPHGMPSQQLHMYSGDIIEYFFDNRDFSFFLCSINDTDNTCTITIREYIPYYN